MKQMKQFFFALCVLMISGTSVFAQCEPDTTLGNALGLYPNSLPQGFVGVPYDQVINVVVPEDTVLELDGFVFAFDICKITLDSIPNLPAGMSLDCGTSPCVFEIDHTDEDSVGRYCLSISGTPEAPVSNDSLDIFVSVEVGTFNPNSGECDPLPITIPPELLSIQFRARFVVREVTDVCEPDASVGTVPGLYPPALPEATIGVPYAQVVNVVVPEDTSVNLPPFGDLSLNLCGLTVDSIPNLPAGMSYDCNEPDCNFTFDLSDTIDVSYICVTLSGTPESMVLPDDSIDIYVNVEVGSYNETTGVCDAFPVSLPSELTSIRYRLPLIVGPPVGIEPLQPADISLNLFPNPTAGRSVMRYELPEQAVVSLSVYDLFGRKVREVYNGRAAAGSHTHEVDMNGLSKGLYLVQLKLNNGESTFTKKLLYN